jgi:hypothetical protein
MYSFAQRDDVQVVDEPLYGHYLRVSGADHPGAKEVLAAMNCDGDSVVRELLGQQTGPNSRRLFLKHMAHHLIELDLSFLKTTDNVFLIRDPCEMLPSLVNQLPNAQLADTGLQQQWQLFSDLAESGVTSAILDSRELLLDPAGVLEKLCDFLDLEFSAEMLHWQAGPRHEDGVWAPHWYHAVHQSVGFEPYKPKVEFPRRLESLLAECQPWYSKLFERAIRAEKTGDQM